MELYLDDNDSIEKLKEQLKMYKSLNRDLSKKVQELKVELNETKSAFAISQNQLLEKGRLVKEYKNHLKKINSQCFQFCTNYFNTVNEINEQNPDVTLNFPKESNDGTPNKQPKQIVKPPRRHSLPNDAEMLGVIAEESLNHRSGMQTSTPFHQRRKFGSHMFLKSFDSMSSNVS
jgi:regulator of replication initiation timing